MTWALRQLGLPADADERAVKRAYAAKLKSTRPETDPEGFQALHEAYQAALSWISARDAGAFDDDIEDDLVDDHHANDDFVATSAGAAHDASQFFDFSPTLDDGDILQPAPTPAPRLAADADESEAFDAQAFYDHCIMLAANGKVGELEQWLHAQPVLWSLQHKSSIGHWLLQSMYEHRPSIRPESFDVLSRFFAFDDLNSGYDAHYIQLLRNRLSLAWELQTSQMRALAERTANDGGSLASNLRQAQRVLAQVSQPLRWQQALWAALLPGFPSAVRNFLRRLDYGRIHDLPAPIRDDQIAFWDAAGDRSRWSKPRWMVSVSRLFAYSALATGLAWLAIIAFASERDGAPIAVSVIASVVFGLMLSAWLSYLIFDTFTDWQSQREESLPRWPVLRWAAIPILVVTACGLYWGSEQRLPAALLIALALVAAWMRYRERNGAPLGRFVTAWRLFFFFMAFRLFLSDRENRYTGYLLATLALLTLGLWASDLWKQRHWLRRGAPLEDLD